jgi:hypothetical protein
VHLHLGRLLHLHEHAPLVLRLVGAVPPVGEVAARVVLAALVVEAVRHLVPDDWRPSVRAGREGRA